MSKKKVLLLGISLLVVGVPLGRTFLQRNFSSLTDVEQQDIRAWVRSSAMPIIQYSQDSIWFQKDATIDTLIGEARVIGLGEATHGTHESNVLNCSIIKYMVVHRRCTKIVVESSFPSMEILNRYITGDSITKGEMFFALSTSGLQKSASFYDLVCWLRKYNQSLDSNKVTLHGVDIYRGSESARLLLEFFRKGDREYYNQNNFQKAQYSMFDADQMYKQTKEEFKSRLLCTKLMYQRLLQKNHHYAKLTDSVTIKRMIHHAQHLLQNLMHPDVRDSNNILSVWDANISNPRTRGTGYEAAIHAQYRDSCMFANLEQLILSTPSDERVVLWQHNDHIANVTVEIPFTLKVKRLGRYLREHFGTTYQAIGYAFYKGDMQLGGRIESTELPPPSAMESLLHNVFDTSLKKAFALRFVSAPVSIQKILRSKPMLLRKIGSELTKFTRQYFESTVGEEFDVIIFFEQTTPTQYFKL